MGELLRVLQAFSETHFEMHLEENSATSVFR